MRVSMMFEGIIAKNKVSKEFKDYILMLSSINHIPQQGTNHVINEQVFNLYQVSYEKTINDDNHLYVKLYFK